jgi:hypothetical protein
MTVAMRLKENSIFEVIPESELLVLFSQVYGNSISLIGRCGDGAVVVFRPKGPTESFELFNGSYRSNSTTKGPIEATFSFVLHDSKFLFKASLNRNLGRKGQLRLLTTIYRIQRRAVKRLNIPNDYYAVVRLSHQNHRLIRVFGKLSDISPRGIGVLLPKNDNKIQLGDQFKAVLTISQRPPENVELRLIHLRPALKHDETTGEKVENIFFGAVFLPENSMSIFKRMNAVVTDIYRDVFGTLTIPKN